MHYQSLSLFVFRTNFLQPDTIGILPHHGYNPEHKQPIKALQWLKYIFYSERLAISLARNGGEKCIVPYRVDVNYETSSGEKVVLEFHGYFWHGKPFEIQSIYDQPREPNADGKLYDRTTEKQKY